MFEDLQGLLEEVPTPPITPPYLEERRAMERDEYDGSELEQEVEEEEDMPEDLEEIEEDEDNEGLSDDTLETPSSGDTWKQQSLFGEDTSSVLTEDSLSGSLRPRRANSNGKRVTFPADELLVRVFFIPVDCGPCMEELVPCDPETLVENVSEMTIEGFSPLGAASRTSGGGSRTSVGKTLETTTSASPMPRFGRGLLGSGGVVGGPAASGVGKYSTPTMKALGRGLCIQGRPSPTAPKPAPRKRSPSGFLSTDAKMDSPVPEDTYTNITPHTKTPSPEYSAESDPNHVINLSPRKSERGPKETTSSKHQTVVPAPKMRAVKSASSSGRRRQLPLTPEERLEPLFRHANRKVRSAVWSGKHSEPLPRSSEGRGSVLHGHLQTRRLQGVTSRSTPALHRIQSASSEDLRAGRLNRSRSISYDNVKMASGPNGGVHRASPAVSGIPGDIRGTGRRSGGRRALTRRSLPERSESTSGSAAIVVSERLTTLTSGAVPPLPRIHPSPYRQSSLPSLGHRSATFTEPSATGNRDRGDQSSGHVHAMKHVNTPLATRKLYAWHMANGTLGKNAHLETPCISPLWDCLPKAGDSPVPTSLS